MNPRTNLDRTALFKSKEGVSLSPDSDLEMMLGFVVSFVCRWVYSILVVSQKRPRRKRQRATLLIGDQRVDSGNRMNGVFDV